MCDDSEKSESISVMGVRRLTLGEEFALSKEHPTERPLSSSFSKSLSSSYDSSITGSRAMCEGDGAADRLAAISDDNSSEYTVLSCDREILLCIS